MLNKSGLIKYFENGIKNTSEIKIGTEHEKFIYHKSDLSLVSFSGDVSISSIFDDFINDGWTPVEENENIIALNNCLLYTSPSPRDYAASRMPSSA